MTTDINESSLLKTSNTIQDPTLAKSTSFDDLLQPAIPFSLLCKIISFLSEGRHIYLLIICSKWTQKAAGKRFTRYSLPNPIPAFTSDYLLSIQHVSISTTRQLDVQNLSALSSLQTLDLSESRSIYTIDPLATLTNLTSLSLSLFCIADLSALRNLLSLTRLQLKDSFKIENFKFLESLTNLGELLMSHCPLRSISLPLGSLAVCTKLELLHNEMSNVDFVSNLVNLKHLKLLAPPLDFAPSLSALSFLTHLDMDYSNILSLTPLSNLTSLRSLHLSHCYRLYDLVPLRCLKNLQVLKLNSSRFLDINESLLSLALGTIKLQDLSLEFTTLSTLANVGKIASLKNLSLKGNKFETAQPLSQLTCLSSLVLYNKLIDRLPSMQRFDELRSLRLSAPLVTDFSSISWATNLELLSLTGCTKMDTISCLENLEKLKYLSLSKCKEVHNLESLSYLTSIIELNLSSMNISDLSFAVALRKLTSLDISNSQCDYVYPFLKDLPSLQYLNVQHCPSIRDLDRLCLVSPKISTFSFPLQKCDYRA